MSQPIVSTGSDCCSCSCCDSDNNNLEDRLRYSNTIKRSSSVGGQTLATMAESECEYSLASSNNNHKDHDTSLEKSQEQRQQQQTENGNDDLDDSLSSQEEASEQFVSVSEREIDADQSINGTTSCCRTMPRDKVPSSLHIPSVMEEEVNSPDRKQNEDTKTAREDSLEAKEEEEDLSTNLHLNQVYTMEDPLMGEAAVVDVSEEVDDANDDRTVVTCTSAGPQRKSVDMNKYKPSDRSITVALNPSKPLLRRHSSYGNKNEKIPLNFNKRGSVKVLPKPDLQALGSDALKTRVSAPPPSVSTSSNSKGSTSKNRVVFDKIAIREHRITMGDNPSCSYGTPISLDWDYIDFEELTLEDYEMHKITSGRGRPRTLRQLYLNHFQRIHRFQQEGYTLEEIKARKHETNKARKQREMTRFMAQTFLVHVEDIVESAGRKVSRVMKTGKNKGKSEQRQQQQGSHRRKLSKKEQEKQLLLKIMGGDDTVDTAQVVQSERDSRNDHLMPISIRSIEG
ncbi:hypothetical protein IV203_034086 [Nitzschia inconspicua]|uniref:Uncharacterized protein n=1 Tax=Nitzschia inconspicua TaxID=303405 RepID=A0A9K3Q6K0_9STRA|nr:hypothetical protein IV203_034086 [Nitzschia inconspicua]